MKQVILTLTAVLVLSPALALAQQPGGMHHEMPKPTNLQVLPKDISPPDLIKLMRGYSGQLGVKCSFCHAEDRATKKINFASDANPEKGIARTMIAMNTEINKKYMSQIKDPDMPTENVQCGTCHRGHSMPQTYTPPPEKEHH